jgi:uncharacterized phage protein (TIGR02218 family)
MPGSTIPTQFETNERSDSQPVHCYTFVRGTTVWRYTDQAEDVTLSSVTYRAAAIAHSEFARDDEGAAGEITVTLSTETPIVADLNGKMSGPPITLTIRQTHRSGVGGVTPVTAVRYKGHLTARRLAGGVCELTVASISSLLERPLLRWIAAPTCQKTVYSPECGVDPSAFTVTGKAVTVISGRTLTITDADANGDDYYTAGYLVIETGTAAGERLFIQSQVGTAVTLLHDPPPGLVVTNTVALTAGCDGVEATCDTKFANIDHFGGFPRVPVINPFDQVD